VEGRLLDAPSVNQAILARRDALAVTDKPGEAFGDMIRAGSRVVSAKTREGRVLPGPRCAWLIPPSGDLKGVVVSPELAKGASVEEVAAKYREIRKLLQLYAALGSGGLTGAMSPSASLFAALCMFYDEVVKMYCYSAVTMGLLAESLEADDPGAFDPEAARKKAAELCDVKGDPGDLAQRLGGALGYGFARGWAESLAGAGIGWGLGRYAGLNAKNLGEFGKRILDGALSTGVGLGNPTPASTPDFILTTTNAIAP
jgi:hypothetical protein